jgi:hypothetical protein
MFVWQELMLQHQISEARQKEFERGTGELKSQMQVLQQQYSTAVGQYVGYLAKHARLCEERKTIVSERDALVTERDVLMTKRDALVIERNALVTERDNLVTQTLCASCLDSPRRVVFQCGHASYCRACTDNNKKMCETKGIHFACPICSAKVVTEWPFYL